MSKIKILIIGGTGMLGHKLVQALKNDFQVACTIRNFENELNQFEFLNNIKIYENVDVKSIEIVENVIKDFCPEYVINAVGIIKQLPEAKQELLTLNINSIFPKKLSQLIEKYNFNLINISTDCVFSGTKGSYSEAEFTDADDLYGKSKYLGEVTGEKCLTIRTSIIGRELFSNHSLLEWFLSVKDETVRGFTNAVFSGLPTQILSEIIKDILIRFPNLEGLYHISSEPISKYDLLCLIKEKFNLDTEIVPSDELVIDRSLNSDKFRKLTGFEPKNWDEMIDIMAEDPTPYDKWKIQKF